MKKWKKMLACLLVFCLILSYAPMLAFAEESQEPVTETQETETAESAETGEDTTEPETEGIPPIAEINTSDGEEDEDAITDYWLFLSLLTQLEPVAAEYAAANNKDPYALVLNYIRTGVEKYRDSLWAGVAGAEETAFVEYVVAYDEANETSISRLRNLGNVIVPNGDSIEVVHLIAVMDIANYQSRNDASIAQPYKDFGGWLGDLGDLLYQVQKGNVDCTTDFEAGVTEIRTNYLGVNLGRNCFDMQDIHGDLDAVYLMARHDETGNLLSAMLQEYYTTTLNDVDRASFYMANRYPELNTIAATRAQVYKDYFNNLMAYALEGNRDIDRSAHPEWLKAVCYAWADFICALAGITEFGEYPPEDPDPTPTPSPDPDPIDLDNDYYRVFSSETTTLVPGVTQTVKLAITADDKQMAYYIATADVNRSDITLCAGYKDYDGSHWGMQSLTDQIAAAQAAHAGENFNVIVGTNADFFNMSTGEPVGALVMNGVQYHDVGKEPFFAIMKDGSAMIGTKEEYPSYRDQIQEAVGGNTFLIKDGECVVGKTSTYMSTRASRTCVGITESGKVVLMVLDGRQEPWSCGGSIEEIAQIMLDAGCVTAVNLDGGGSTTYAAKLEGADEVTVVNRPSDGFERRVSSTLMIVSSAVVSNELDHANITATNNYLTPGASTELQAVGVSVSGNSAQLPENATWELSEPIGNMEGNSFVAWDYGDVTVSLVDGETVLGSVDLHVVIPDELAFNPSEFDVIYGETVFMPLTASYENNPVALPTNPDDVEFLLFVELEKQEAGSVEGLSFTAGSADCGARSSKVNVFLWDDDSVTATGTIRLFSEDEASFDFNNCTGGDRILAWNREVSNSTTTDEVTYYQDNPDEDMEIEYTFALDMNDLVIPENIAKALPLVAAFMGEGQVDGSTTAWELLLMLAERISPSTTVTVTVNVDPRLIMDLSGMIVNCQFFDLTNVIYNEETGEIKLICNWIKVYGPIDPGTANPLCIVSGLKGRVKDGAEWDANHEIHVQNTGDIKYMARLRSSAAYNLANSAMGREYGLVPYDNTANLENDRGAEFSSTHTEFEDSFILNNTDLEGWVTTEDGSQFYYVKNQKLTGVQRVRDPENTGSFYYNFGEDGVCRGKFSGLFEINGKLCYAVLGERKTGWRNIDGDYYYFDKRNFTAVDGEQVIDSYHYTFVDHKLTRGEIVQQGEYLKYMWAGAFYRNGWFILDDHKYCARPSEKLCTGFYWIDPYGGGEQVLQHIFGEDGIWHEEINGLYEHTDGETYLADHGIIVQYPGLVEIDGDLYYFPSNNKMVKNRSYWISKTNGILPEKAYDFGPDGKMIRPDKDKNGFYEEDGSIFYYDKGVRVYAGLIEVDGDYYYVRTSGEVVHGRSYWISKTNGLLPENAYEFDDQGHMLNPPDPGTVEPEPTDPPEVKNGIVAENGSLYYYVDGKLTYAGLILLDGNYYYVRTSGELVHGRSYWCTTTNGLLPEQAYTFDDDGKMLNPPDVDPNPPEVKNGIVAENGSLWYYVDGKLNYAGLILLDGNYYYVRTSGELVHGRSYWCTKTNGLLPEQSYTFDDDGRMIDPPEQEPEPTEPPEVKNGIVAENGSLYYYVNGELSYAGLIYLDGYFYYVRSSGEVVHGQSYWCTKTNDLLPENGYDFDDLGRMIDPPPV